MVLFSTAADIIDTHIFDYHENPNKELLSKEFSMVNEKFSPLFSTYKLLGKYSLFPKKFVLFPCRDNVEIESGQGA